MSKERPLGEPVDAGMGYFHPPHGIWINTETLSIPESWYGHLELLLIVQGNAFICIDEAIELIEKNLDRAESAFKGGATAYLDKLKNTRIFTKMILERNLPRDTEVKLMNDYMQRTFSAQNVRELSDEMPRYLGD